MKGSQDIRNLNNLATMEDPITKGISTRDPNQDMKGLIKEIIEREIEVMITTGIRVSLPEQGRACFSSPIFFVSFSHVLVVVHYTQKKEVAMGFDLAPFRKNVVHSSSLKYTFFNVTYVF